MSNKGGRVSPDYLADIAPEYANVTSLFKSHSFQIKMGISF